MLQVLHIENIAVIEEADIAFGGGFNALTGETGAGKSIVIDALGAVLGQRTSRDLIRTGAAKAFVSAVFTGVPAGLPALREQGIEAAGGELLLQREMFADGKNVCRVNGRPVTVAQLRQLGNSLINIHGQHDGQQLLDESFHCAYLDSFGRLEGALGRLPGGLRRVARPGPKAAEPADGRGGAGAPGGHAAPSDRRAGARPAAGGGGGGAAGAAQYPPQQREIPLRRPGGGVPPQRGRREQRRCGPAAGGGAGAVGAAEFGRAVFPAGPAAEELGSEAYDIGETVRDLEAGYEFSPGELDAVESRTDQLYRLKKKYGATVPEMLAYLERCRQELEAITDTDDTLARLAKEIGRAEKRVQAAAKELTAARKAAAHVLEARIQEELRQLDMPKVRFVICLSRLPTRRPAQTQYVFSCRPTWGRS